MAQIDIPVHTYAWFFLRGASLHPDRVTRTLNIAPSYQFGPGDRHGERREFIRKSGFWSISSKDQIQDLSLHAHIIWLLHQLEPVKEKLSILTAGGDIQARLVCVINLFQREWSEELDTTVLQRLGALNIKIGISVYSLGQQE